MILERSSIPVSGSPDTGLADLLDALVENERRLADYYGLMADYLPEYREIWTSLHSQETAHAQTLERIRQAAEERPHLFSAGKIGVGAARMMIADVTAMIDRLERHDVHPGYALTFAMDIENSILESRLDQAVRTDVVEVQNLLHRLNSETASHRQLLRSLLE